MVLYCVVSSTLQPLEACQSRSWHCETYVCQLGVITGQLLHISKLLQHNSKLLQHISKLLQHISKLLQHSSKVFVFDLIQCYFSVNKLTTDFQHASREGRSTCTALTQLTDELFLSINVLYYVILYYVSCFVWTPGRVAAVFATANGDP